mgnify:CR=1 FL=1
MGEAFDSAGQFLGSRVGHSFGNVAEKLEQAFPTVAEMHIRSLVGEGAPSVEMPRYVCHKTVHALKILRISDPTEPGHESDGSRVIVPADKGYGPVAVSREYVQKHDPQPGGYYVVYEDGYASFSPAAAFEGGYRRV